MVPLLSEGMRNRLLGLHLTHAGLAECMIAACYQSVLKPGGGFVDVGARIGAHTVPMTRAVGPEGHGLAIEANPDTLPRLKAALAAPGVPQGVTHVLHAAAHDHVGEVQFHTRPQGQDGMSSIYAEALRTEDPGPKTTYPVPCTTLDAALAAHPLPKVDFLKIDVEDAEYLVLRGAGDLMARHQPLIALENLPREAAARGGYSAADWFGLFETAGYHLVDMFWQPFTAADFAAKGDLPYSYFALPQGRDLGDLIPDHVYLGRLMQHARRLDPGFCP